MKRGTASLGVVLLLTSIIVAVGLVGALLTSVLSTGILGARAGAQAFAAAQSGVDDGFGRILHDGYTDDGPADACSPELGKYCYDLFPLSGAQTAVVMAWQTGVCAKARAYTVTAVGTSFGKHRKLVATVEVDCVTHLTKFTGLSEEPVQASDVP